MDVALCVDIAVVLSVDVASDVPVLVSVLSVDIAVVLSVDIAVLGPVVGLVFPSVRVVSTGGVPRQQTSKLPQGLPNSCNYI